VPKNRRRACPETGRREPRGNEQGSEGLFGVLCVTRLETIGGIMDIPDHCFVSPACGQRRKDVDMRFFPVCLLVLCGALSAAAQSPEPLKTKALSFNINGLYLSGLNGGVGGKLWISESRALVASVNGGISHDVREAPDATSLDTEYTTTSFGVQAGVEQHFPWRPGLSPFLTGGGSFGRYGTVNRSGSVGSPYRQEVSGRCQRRIRPRVLACPPNFHRGSAAVECRLQFRALRTVLESRSCHA
jgi:hypothetical protein